MNAPSLVSGIFEDDFFPFTLTRSVADIRCGILTIREKWNLFLKNNPSVHAKVSIPANIIPNLDLVRSYLKGSSDSTLQQSNKLLHLTDILRYNDEEIRNDFQHITAGCQT